MGKLAAATRSSPDLLAERSGESGEAAAALHRPFRAVTFDWEGTAVVNRQDDTAALVRVTEALLDLDVWLALVTDTNFPNIDRQFCRRVTPAKRQRLLVCANRGSEVYGFDPLGQVVRRYQRVATPTEDRALTAIAEAVRDQIRARTGLEIRIVYDRLNRRKIDLIPLPQWADPPKAHISRLLEVVEQRLRGAGLPGGLREAMALTERVAREYGLPGARITTDVKYIEVGLTDKSDSIAWLARELLQPETIAWHEVLIVGDEFGPIGGFEGSDSRLLAEVGDAVIVSVGPEPNGVPQGVLHLGGGPRHFRALLAEQVRLHRLALPEYKRAGPAAHAVEIAARPFGGATRMAPLSTEATWRIDVPEYLPALERSIETRLTVSNGAFGTRGSPETPLRALHPRTMIGGLFVREPLLPDVPILASGPDWIRLSLWLDGEPMRLDQGEMLEHQRTLDLRHGIVYRVWHYRTSSGRDVWLHTLRAASQATRALAFQIAEIEVAHPTRLAVEAWIEPPPTVSFVAEHIGRSVQVWNAAGSVQQLAVASAVTARLGAQTLEPGTSPATHTVPSTILPTGVATTDKLGRRWEWTALPGQAATLTRLVALAHGPRSRLAVASPAHRALALLCRARRGDISRLVASHARAWRTRWHAGDVTVEGDEATQLALRFALYHLIGAANPTESHASIGARALTGDAYLGHVFWDTDIFVLPFLTCTWPRAARALLLYRYQCLPAARAKARRLGYRGALYAWESADTGEEVTPPTVVMPDGQIVPVLTGTLEQHISADVAYAVWQYWQATEDESFLLKAGAEIVLETARFWASRAREEADGRYHIRGVIGPDEYHEDVDDNAYTNFMAQWNLERGLEVARLLETHWPRRWAALRARLGLAAAELIQWHAVAEGMVTGWDNQSGLIEQFAGFFDLEPINLADYTPRTAPMDVLLGRARTQRAQVVKQADVVMLLALLWERFPPDVRAANFRYYEPRTAHGSSLSPAIHALVAARLGDIALAERYLLETGAIDLDDTTNNAAQGIHIAAQGGLWQAVVFGFAGLSYRADGLALDPHLPGVWQRLAFAVQWRGRHVAFELKQHPLTFAATLQHGRQNGSPLVVRLHDLQHHLRTGETWRCRWDQRTGRWAESSGSPVKSVGQEALQKQEAAP